MSSLINYKTLVISLLIAGMASVAIVVYVGIEKRDVVVEENPYDAGKEFEFGLKRKAELGWQVTFPGTLNRGDSQMVVTVRDRQGRPINDAAIDIRLNRLGSPQVADYRLTGRGDGQYTAAVNAGGSGYWDATAHVKLNRDVVRYDARIYVSPQ
ncbi:MAG: FixH family protein [Nitrospirae bacterium]|nr:FixH family protein [Nitrospirota bacterium]